MSDDAKDLPALRVDGLDLSYSDYKVLSNVSFEVKNGSCLVVMGGSGCGKSTLLKSMVGLHEPASGSVFVGAENLWAAPHQARKSILKRFGVLFQGGALWSSMNLLENVSLPLETYTDMSESAVAGIAQYKLSLVGLSGYEDFYPSQLSGGMRKRAGLARAMALDPEILFFDEPSAGLDPLSSRRLDDLINELKESLGITFVIVSHELASIFEVADDAIFLDAGTKTLLQQGTPSWLLENSQHDHLKAFLSRGSSVSQI